MTSTSKSLLPRPVTSGRTYSAHLNNSLSRVRNSDSEHKGRKLAWPFPLVVVKRDQKMVGPGLGATVQTSPWPQVAYTKNEALHHVGAVWAKMVAAAVLVARLAQTWKPNPSQVQLLIETGLIDCRFFTLFAVVGSLVGSILCFVEGCSMIFKSYLQYFYALSQRMDPGHVVQLLIEAIDMFIVGTAMFTFGMGLYVMFVGSRTTDRSEAQLPQSNLFGLFQLKMVPSWAESQSMSQAKSRVGHAIMMILQVGIVDKFKSIPLVTALDLACFAAALLVSSASIFVLSKLSTSKIY